MKFYPLADFQVQSRVDVTTDEVLLELFEKTIVLRKISNELQKVMLYPASRRDKWLAAHQHFINTLLTECRGQVSFALHGFMHNTAVQPQASEYISTLQQTLSVLERIVRTEQDIQSV